MLFATVQNQVDTTPVDSMINSQTETRPADIRMSEDDGSVSRGCISAPMILLFN
jgi:hypothetical protein